MPQIDIPVKRLMQIRLEDWVEYLIPNCNKDWIIEMDAEKVPAKKESRLDKLILIEAPNERYIKHRATRLSRLYHASKNVKI